MSMSTALRAAALAFVLLIGPCSADCPDAGLRCRIAVSNTGSTASETGCEGGGEVGAQATEGVVTGSVTVNGKCWQVEKNSDNAEFIVVGTTRAGQCYNLFQGGCQPGNCGTPPGDVCNRDVPDCTIYGPDVCTAPHAVVEGENCNDLAMSNNVVNGLAGLQALNPDVTCDNLQIGTQLCLAKGQGPGQTLCEAIKTSG